MIASDRGRRVSIASMRMPSSKGALAALLLAAAVGCSSGGAVTSDAGTDAPSACGDAAPCTSGQVCVGEQSCGTAVCSPVPDGGAAAPAGGDA